MKSKLLIFIFSILTTFSFANQKTLNIAISSDLRSIDPRISADAPSCHIIYMLYEGLMRKDKEGTILPGIAEKYSVSEDGLKYIFHLRDAKWSNGDPVTAYDFECAWEKNINHRTANKSSYTFYPIKNAKAYLEQKVAFDAVGIKAVNEKTLEVELLHPVPYFLELTASCIGYMPISKKLEEKEPKWANKDTYVFNGPFYISKRKHNSEIILKKNERYWNKDNVNLPEINIQVVFDNSTLLKLFEKGQLDWCGHPLNDMNKDEIKKNDKSFNFINQSCVDWLTLNLNNKYFRNKNFRKALCLAINRKELADTLSFTKKPTTCILNDAFQIAENPFFEDGNVDQAKDYLNKALKELGIKKEEIAPIKFSIRNTDISRTYAQVIQEQIRKSLGLTVILDQSEWIVHLNKLQAKDYEIGELGWVSAVNDPIYILDVFRSRLSNMNTSGWESDIFQQLLEDSNFEMDPLKRKVIIGEAEKILVDDLPVIPIFSRIGCYKKNPRLKDVYLGHLNNILFTEAYFESK